MYLHTYTPTYRYPEPFQPLQAGGRLATRSGEVGTTTGKTNTSTTIQIVLVSSIVRILFCS